MTIAPLSPPDVLTLGGASVVVSILVGAVLKAFAITGSARNRYGPAIALATGTVVVTIFSIAQNADVLAGALTGFLAGAGSTVVYDQAAKPLLRTMRSNLTR